MPQRLTGPTRAHLEKARSAAISAVEVYNRPGSAFRTPHYLVLITIAWTALFHAIFYNRHQRPWHRKKAGKAFRYVRVDGEFKHWELEECCNQFWGTKNPPERENIRFLIGLRNRIEHRDLVRGRGPVDAHVERVRAVRHCSSFDPGRSLGASSVPVLALEARLPTGCAPQGFSPGRKSGGGAHGTGCSWHSTARSPSRSIVPGPAGQRGQPGEGLHRVSRWGASPEVVLRAQGPPGTPQRGRRACVKWYRGPPLRSGPSGDRGETGGRRPI